MSVTPQAAFISYSREDSKFALRLAKDLKAAGALVWLDQVDIRAGHPWDDAIETALSEALQMILILSPASTASKNVRDEISFALHKGKAIIPALYKDCELPLRLQRSQQIDFRTDYDAGLAALLGHLREQSASPLEQGRQSAVGPRRISRRQLAIGGGLAAGALAGGIGWKRRWLYDHFHRIPDKRFVAVVSWPVPDEAFKPTLLGVIDAIAGELSRAEASDRNLLVIAGKTGGELKTAAQLQEYGTSLGANLVLGVSGAIAAGECRLMLQVLDTATSQTLREQAVAAPLQQQLRLPEQAVQTAAELLNISDYDAHAQRSGAGTNIPDAYAAYQAAEALMQQDNDAGLAAAIDNYRAAIAKDPNYAIAQARLAWAYLRSYGIKPNPGALTLATSNARSAIQLDDSLVEGHLALASAYQQTGDTDRASREMAKALSLDPANAHTLIYQARFYAGDNRWTEAEETFDRVLKLRPNYWLAYQELGVILDRQGEYREALTAFRSASLAAPKNALALRNVGNAYLRLGRIPEAIAALHGSYALKQDDISAVALAEAFRLQRKYGEAIESAQRAVKLNPNEPYNWLELGDIYSAFGRRTDADSAYTRAVSMQQDELQTSPKDGPGWMLLALSRVKAGKPATALDLIAKAELLHADDMDSQLSKVRILELIGKRQDALATIKRCLARGQAMFQIETMPDLDRLRASEAFKAIKVSAVSDAGVGQA